ncbi:hypothetical protein A5630_01160 [Mycolicibacterium mucogenicum]|uniref:Uncharacterized protein n=1 Tax=Mycolicibacterium mucogenicum TaxID=56689 RepID=A0A1A3HDC3_MYCMU|nr:hypothetical protein A5630_01160 [Mycolicibacterium mucogenicum]
MAFCCNQFANMSQSFMTVVRIDDPLYHSIAFDLSRSSSAAGRGVLIRSHAARRNVSRRGCGNLAQIKVPGGTAAGLPSAARLHLSAP